MHVVWGHGDLVLTGILDPGISERTLRGWRLMPPDEFGGLANFRVIPLDLEKKAVRKVLYRETGAPYLRYYMTPDVMFDLEALAEPLAEPSRPIAV